MICVRHLHNCRFFGKYPFLKTLLGILPVYVEDNFLKRPRLKLLKLYFVTRKVWCIIWYAQILGAISSVLFFQCFQSFNCYAEVVLHAYFRNSAYSKDSKLQLFLGVLFSTYFRDMLIFNKVLIIAEYGN